MQSLLVLSILFGVLAAYSMAISEERMKIVKECQDQEKASDEDVQAFRNHRITPSGKCLVACVNEKIGGMKDGKIDADAVKASFKDKGDNEKFNKAVDTCQSVTNADRCELAFQFYECMKKSLGHDSDASN